MTIFTVENYTRYNTDDIIALMSAIEEAIYPDGVKPVAAQVWRPRVGRVNSSGTLRFKVYSPKPGSENFVKGRGAHYVSSEDVRIVVPERLYDSPVEALASTAEGGHRVPYKLMEQLVEALVTRYDLSKLIKSTDWRAKRKAGEDAKKRAAQCSQELDLCLRYSHKAAAKEPASVRRERKDRLLAQAAREVGYAYFQSGHALHKRVGLAGGKLASLEKRAEGLNFPETAADAKRIASLTAKAEALLKEAGRIAANVQARHPVT